MDYFVFLLFLLITVIFALIPFFILYPISDFIAFFLNKILGYRSKVVDENLKIAFPEKSEKERKKIKNDFYKNLSDTLLETIKGNTLTNKSIKKRYAGKKIEVIDKLFKENKPVIITMGHMANWEWGSYAIPLFVKNDIYVIYKPIKNKYIDSYIKKNRSKNGMITIPLKQTGNYFKRYANKASSIILVSDQSPSNTERAVWVDFLGRKTAFVHGIEFYSRIFDIPVVYLAVQRIKRGHYEFELSLLHDNPKELKPGEITQMYASKLEEEIKKSPSDWLWSHRRWKHSWEDFKHKQKGK